MKNYSPCQMIFILAPFVLSFAFGLDIYIPIIPMMTEIFQTSPAKVQLTMSLFLLTSGVGQLLIGPLSDRFGRRVIFFLASSLYLISSLCCAFAPGINTLIFFRILTALGACGLLVTAFATVRDLYSSEESAKMYSLLNGAIGISPTFAPIIGGYLALYFGWQSVFFFLTFIGCFAFAFAGKFISETHPKEKRISFNWSIFSNYRSVITNRQFIAYSAIAGFSSGILFCFFSVSLRSTTRKKCQKTPGK